MRQFILVVGLGVALFILVPRWPSFEFDTDTPLRATGNDAVFNAGVFSFSAALATSISTKDTFLPLAFCTLRVTVNDVETGKIIATVRTCSIAATDDRRAAIRPASRCPLVVWSPSPCRSRSPSRASTIQTRRTHECSLRCVAHGACCR